MAGFAVWLVAGILLLDPLSASIFEDCLSGICSPPLEAQLAAAAVVAFAISAGVALAVARVLRRLIYGRSP